MRLNNVEVAALATFLRQRWTNTAKAVSETHVQSVRKLLEKQRRWWGSPAMQHARLFTGRACFAALVCGWAMEEAGTTDGRTYPHFKVKA